MMDVQSATCSNAAHPITNDVNFSLPMHLEQATRCAMQAVAARVSSLQGGFITIVFPDGTAWNVSFMKNQLLESVSTTALVHISERQRHVHLTITRHDKQVQSTHAWVSHARTAFYAVAFPPFRMVPSPFCAQLHCSKCVVHETNDSGVCLQHYDSTRTYSENRQT